MKKIIYLLFIVFPICCLGTDTGKQAKPVVYLIPGQGADSRLFKNLQIDSAFETVHIEYVVPEKGCNMADYAKILSSQIDSTREIILIGVSLGGMLATEMNDFLKTEKTILISSAKSRDEFPGRYTFQHYLPIYKLFTGRMIKRGALIMQPIVEPDRDYDTNTFKEMLKAKDPDFMKRSVTMILQWKRKTYPDNITHIHGEKDHTLPIRNIKFDYKINGGSHMMVLTKGEEISALINHILLDGKTDAYLTKQKEGKLIPTETNK